MNNEESAGIAARALALLLLLLALGSVLLALADGMGVIHHWKAVSAREETYWVRYYGLLFAERILSATVLLYVAGELRRGNPRLLRYLAGTQNSAD